MIYDSSFLKIFRIAEVLVLDFRKLTESQKLWFQFFEKKIQSSEEPPVLGLF